MGSIMLYYRLAVNINSFITSTRHTSLPIANYMKGCLPQQTVESSLLKKMRPLILIMRI